MNIRDWMVEKHFVMKGSIILGAVVAFFGLSFFDSYRGRAPPSLETSLVRYSESKAHQRIYEQECREIPRLSISKPINYLLFEPDYKKGCIDWFLSEPFKLWDSTIRKRIGCFNCHTLNGIRILAEKYNHGEEIIHP